jgi:tetratricopeptide (TPR) repeat protein
MVRCPQCSQHFTAEEPEPLVVRPVVAAGSPALKTGLIAFGAVGTLALVLAAIVVAAVSTHTDKPAPPPESDHRPSDDRLAALQRRLEEQQEEASRERRRRQEQQDAADHERRRLEQAVRDLESRARVAEQKPAPPVVVAAPPAESKAAADDAARKVRADYEARMDAGRAALVAQRYADALREYTAALALVPGDAAALRGQRDAQNRLDGQQDRQKRQANASTLVDKAKAAFRAKHYDEAISDANQALRENPDDPDARQIQRDATQAKRTARTDSSQFMSAADAALAQGRYEEASRLYDRILQQTPDDEAAQRGKRSADQSLQDTQASLNAYYRFMAMGTLSMQNLQYADAARAFAEALRQSPGDLAAARGLSDAQNAVAGVVVGQANFYRALQNGYAALQAQRPADATTAFQSALRLVPDSPLAVAGLRQARAMKKPSGTGQ